MENNSTWNRLTESLMNTQEGRQMLVDKEARDHGTIFSFCIRRSFRWWPRRCTATGVQATAAPASVRYEFAAFAIAWLWFLVEYKCERRAVDVPTNCARQIHTPFDQE